MKNNSANKLHFISFCTYEYIKNIFDKNGIDFLILKGPYLAYTIYEDPFKRIWSDLDLLVPPNSFDNACNLLKENKFEEVKFPPRRRYTFKSYYQHSLKSPYGIVCEIHRDFSNLGKYPIDIDKVFKTKVEFDFGSVKAYGLSNEYLLFNLCIHLLKSYFDVDEKHLLDIKYLLEKRKIDWDNFCEIVDKGKAKSGVYFVLVILENNYLSNIPSSVLNFLKPKGLRYLYLKKILNINGFPLNKLENKESFYNRIMLNYALLDKTTDFIKLFFKYSYNRIMDLFLG